jgi:hypothetical protein
MREGKRAFERLDNIKIDLKEIECEGVKWIQPAQDASGNGLL